MCCFNIIDAVADFFKCVIACFCFLIIGGPVLIALGSIQLTKDNGLNEFRRAVENFDPTSINTWSGTINEGSITVRRLPLNVEEVNGAVSVFAAASIPAPTSGSSSMRVSVSITGVQPFSRNVPLALQRTTTYTCTSSDCSSSSSSCRCTAALTAFRSRCTSSGGDFTPAAAECTRGSACGTCRQRVYLSTLYLVVTEPSAGGLYVEDTYYRSAKYDFSETANDYSTTLPSTITVRVYTDKDPYIVLQKITKGTNEFGIKPRTVGIVLIVIGSFLLLLEIAVCTALICYCIRRKRDPEGPPPPSTSSAPPGVTDAPGYVTSNAYGQPPPATQGYSYGQPPPATQGYSYGQPPPATQGYSYGQPPPATQGYSYGQPPPATQGYSYGQPPPPKQEVNTYGQPPI